MDDIYIKLKNIYENNYNIKIYLNNNIINLNKYYKYLNNDFSISNEYINIKISYNNYYIIILEDSIGILNNKYIFEKKTNVIEKINILLK